MKDYIDANGWATSNDLIQVVNQWPMYRPNMEREDELTWLLSKDGNFSIMSVWEQSRRSHVVAKRQYT